MYVCGKDMRIKLLSKIINTRQTQGTHTKGEKISTVDLLVLTSFNQLILLIENIIYLCYKTSYLNEEDNLSEPFPSVSC
jgi:hypothetical protein